MMSHEIYRLSESPGDPPQASLAGSVREMEQARRFFEEEREYARSTPHDVAALLELIQFYGRAFAQVIRRLPDELSADAWQVQVMQEAVVGRTAYWEWRRCTTGTAAPLELYQMQFRWENIVGIVGDDKGLL
jgi:hypothetical protein